MFNVDHLIQVGGLFLVGLFLFSEVGFLLGFFLPGDSLLIAAGVFASQGKLPLLGVIIVGALAAIGGDSLAYLIGRKLGRRVFMNKNSLMFSPSRLRKAEKYYTNYGSLTVLVAHYMPFIRTVSPLLGGVAKMPYSKFLAFDGLGDTSWAIVLSLAGFFLGKKFPTIDHYVLYAVGLVIVLSAGPTAIHLILKKKRSIKAKKLKDSS